MLLVLHAPLRSHTQVIDEEGNDYDSEEAPFEARDISDGYAARFDAYRAAWDECLQRIQVRPLAKPLKRLLTLLL